MSPETAPLGCFDQADVVREVGLAESRIRPFVRETWLEPSPALSGDGDCSVLLKLENLQVTSSFKARGAFNKLLTLSPAERARGIVTASTGNHGNATAHALALLGIEGQIFLPASASPAKIEGLRSRGADLRLIDDDPGRVETVARTEAERSGRVFISPYNDPQVIGGQGTIAPELLRQAEALGVAAVETVFVPVGGGGLIAGIAGYLKAAAPHVRVVGCSPVASPVMAESVKAGRLVDIPWTPSLSDATVGSIEPGSITFPICATCVDEWVSVSEAEIAEALRLVVERHLLLIEGAAALAVACFLATRQRWAGQTVALVLSGARIPSAKLAEVLAARF
jgi:threonine dehydratase